MNAVASDGAREQTPPPRVIRIASVISQVISMMLFFRILDLMFGLLHLIIAALVLAARTLNRAIAMQGCRGSRRRRVPRAQRVIRIIMMRIILIMLGGRVCALRA